MQLIHQVEPRNVMLVHGEKKKMEYLKEKIIQEYGIPCYNPPNGTTVTIPTSLSVPVEISLQLIENQMKEKAKRISSGANRQHASDCAAVNGILVSDETQAVPKIRIIDLQEVSEQLHVTQHELTSAIVVPLTLDEQPKVDVFSESHKVVLEVIYEELSKWVSPLIVEYNRDQIAPEISLRSISITIHDNYRSIRIAWSFSDEYIAMYAVELVKEAVRKKFGTTILAKPLKSEPEEAITVTETITETVVEKIVTSKRQSKRSTKSKSLKFADPDNPESEKKVKSRSKKSKRETVDSGGKSKRESSRSSRKRKTKLEAMKDKDEIFPLLKHEHTGNELEFMDTSDVLEKSEGSTLNEAVAEDAEIFDETDDIEEAKGDGKSDFEEQSQAPDGITNNIKAEEAVEYIKLGSRNTRPSLEVNQHNLMKAGDSKIITIRTDQYSPHSSPIHSPSHVLNREKARTSNAISQGNSPATSPSSFLFPTANKKS